MSISKQPKYEINIRFFDLDELQVEEGDNLPAANSDEININFVEPREKSSITRDQKAQRKRLVYRKNENG